MTLEPKSLSKAPLALMTLLTLAGTSSAQDYHARVRLHSDVFLPITGHRWEIRQGSNAWNLSTDAAGFTSYVEPVAGTAMEVILHPGPSTHGRLVRALCRPRNAGARPARPPTGPRSETKHTATPPPSSASPSWQAPLTPCPGTKSIHYGVAGRVRSPSRVACTTHAPVRLKRPLVFAS